MPAWGVGLAAIVVAGMLAGGYALRPDGDEAPGSAALVAGTPGAGQVIGSEEDADPVVVTLGDSYTAGAGASAAGRGWVDLVGASKSWRVQNLARGGTGFETAVSGDAAPSACGREICPSFAEMAIEGAAVLPDIVIVSGGRNNIGDDDAADGVRRFFANIRQSYPTSVIYVTNVLWHEDAPESVDALSAVVRVEAEKTGAIVVDIGQPLAADTAMLASDGVHPSDAGHAAIAEAVLAAIP